MEKHAIRNFEGPQSYSIWTFPPDTSSLFRDLNVEITMEKHAHCFFKYFLLILKNGYIFVELKTHFFSIRLAYKFLLTIQNWNGKSVIQNNDCAASGRSIKIVMWNILIICNFQFSFGGRRFCWWDNRKFPPHTSSLREYDSNK